MTANNQSISLKLLPPCNFYYGICRCAVQLTGTNDPREGILLVDSGYGQGTVCDNFFNDAAAQVVCYMLGFG